jgi:hypothetical protein
VTKKKEKKTYRNGNKTCWEACRNPDKPKAGECNTVSGGVVCIPEIETIVYRGIIKRGIKGYLRGLS